MIERIVIQKVTKKDGTTHSYTVIVFVNGAPVYRKTSKCSDVADFAKVIIVNQKGWHTSGTTTEFGTFVDLITETYYR